MSATPDDDDDEILQGVIVEGLEGLESIVADLELAQRGETGKETISKVFRTFHSLKGNAGMVGLTGVERFCHGVEGALNKLREGKVKPTGSRIESIVYASDLLTQLLQTIDSSVDFDSIGEDKEEFLSQLEAEFLEDAEDAVVAEEPPKSPATGVAPKNVDSQALLDAVPATSSYIRVSIEDLDACMHLGGELFNIDEQLKTWIHKVTESELEGPALNELRAVGRDLSGAMAELYARLLTIQEVSIQQITRPLERIVRDVCRSSGKNIRMELIGDELRLERPLLEILNDPLVHMIRNSVDHGIEEPEERAQSGKPKVATIRLEFRELDESIEVIIQDDGRGIDLDAVKAKAVEQGLITQAAADRMTETEQIELIYRPGLSTKKQVSKLSGRGVGMDVVISNLRRKGGIIQATTERGRGTTFMLEIPKAGSPVVEGLAIRVGRVVYLLPMKNVCRFMPFHQIELKRMPSGQILGSCSMGHLPIVELESLYSDNDEQGGDSSRAMAIVIEDRSRGNFIVKVDEVIGWRKALISEIPNWTTGDSILSGAFTLGDGAIGFTIWIERLSERLLRAAPAQLPSKRTPEALNS